MSTMKSTQTAYAYPTTSSSSCAEVAKVSSGASVSVLFSETESGTTYYYISFLRDGTNCCGYVPASSVNLTESISSFTTSAAKRYVGTTTQSKYGPASTYFDAIPLPKSKSVTYLGKKESNGYAFVQAVANGLRYRAFVDSSCLKTSSVATVTGKEQMCQIAELEVGNSGRKFWDWYGVDGVSWCAIFVSWCANFAGILVTGTTVPAPYVYKTMSVTSMRNVYSNNSRLLTASSATPQRGDIAFFKDDAHVGIVTAVSGSTITLVEGNCSKKVRSYSYTKGTSGYTGGSGTIVYLGR